LNNKIASHIRLAAEDKIAWIACTKMEQANNRFKPTTKYDLQKILIAADSVSTKRVIERSKKLFNDFLVSASIDIPINEMSKEFVNEQVELFLASIRKLGGDEMKKKSLDSVKYGLSKFLMIDYKIDLSSSDFSGTKRTYTAKQLKKDCKGSVQHKSLIEIAGLEKLNDVDCLSFRSDTPCGPQNRVWFFLMWYPIRRG
jgi:hypothetical protein